MAEIHPGDVVMDRETARTGMVTLIHGNGNAKVIFQGNACTRSVEPTRLLICERTWSGPPESFTERRNPEGRP